MTDWTFLSRCYVRDLLDNLWLLRVQLKRPHKISYLTLVTGIIYTWTALSTLQLSTQRSMSPAPCFISLSVLRPLPGLWTLFSCYLCWTSKVLVLFMFRSKVLRCAFTSIFTYTFPIIHSRKYYAPFPSCYILCQLQLQSNRAARRK